MIFTFHWFYLSVLNFIKQWKQNIANEEPETKKFVENKANEHTSSFRDAELNVKFDPPVYKQRYEAIQRVIVDERWRSSIQKLVDFGCAEFGLFLFLKRLYNLREILAVDIDTFLLQENIFKLRPLNADFLKRRPQPLEIKVLRGSISDPDPILIGTDMVIAIEIIEHLYPDVLEALPYNVFSFIQPKVAVFTTPNADFNILFPSRSGFRHYDHKFEWTRDQFEAWAMNIKARFPNYEVEFSGIGSGPKDTMHLGHCSQMAVFFKKDLEAKQNCDVNLHAKETSHGVCTYCSCSKQIVCDSARKDTDSYYTLLETVTHPYDKNPLSPEEKIICDVKYQLHLLGRVYGRFYNEEKNRAEIPIDELITNEEGVFVTVSELRTILEQSGFKIEECLTNSLQTPQCCVIYEPEMEYNSTPTTESSVSGYDNNEQWNSDQDNVSDWDDVNSDLPRCSLPLGIPEVNQDMSAKTDASELLKVDETDHGTEADLINNDVIEISEDITNQENTLTTHSIKVDVLTCSKDSNIEKPFSNKKNNIILHSNKERRPTTPDTINVLDIPLKTLNSQKDFKNSRSSVGIKQHNNAKSDVNVSTRDLPRKVLIKDLKEPIAGTSNTKKRKKSKSEDELIREDIQNIAQCIVINSLNTIDDLQDSLEEQSDVFEDALVDNTDVDANGCDTVGNIDGEAVDENVVDQFYDPVAVDTNNQDNQNKTETLELTLDNDITSETELAFASREALFDPNSQVDLLEDFEIPPAPASEASVPEMLEDEQQELDVDHQNIVIIGVNLINEDNDGLPPFPPDPFPNWLLQLLGTDVMEDPNQHDEPHFYCQGDGVGVHPSIIEVDIEEEPSSSDTSSNNSSDDIEAEHTLPEAIPLPEDASDIDEGVADTVEDMRYNVEYASTSNDSTATDEFFDTVEDANSSGQEIVQTDNETKR